ncbi:hypothetical protein BYT27DRAFT_7214897 [Phlegmacium glaucopus]|nr:hypothetical protein BYT27DRAFT_7214897 [Phlegmacium glaucopus]
MPPHPHSSLLETFEGILSILTLGNYAQLSNCLHPDTYSNDGVDPVERLFLIHVRKKSKKLISYLNSSLEIISPCNEALTLLHLSQSYQLQQAYALEACFKQAVSSGLKSPIAGLTEMSLHAQLKASLGDDFSKNPTPQQDTEPSFYWGELDYRVRRYAQGLPSDYGEPAFYLYELLLRGGLETEEQLGPEDVEWMESGEMIHVE